MITRIENIAFVIMTHLTTFNMGPGIVPISFGEYSGSNATWRHGMGMLAELLALCEGNPPATGGFSSQRASNGALSWFLCYQSEEASKQTIDFMMMWGASITDAEMTSL